MIESAEFGGWGVSMSETEAGQVLMCFYASIYLCMLMFRLKEDTGNLAKVRDKMQKKLSKYVAFQQYLDKVLEKAEEVSKLKSSYF